MKANQYYTTISVPEAAKLIEADTTFVYKLIRDGKLRPADNSPIKLTIHSIIKYLEKRIPSGFKLIEST